MAWKRAKKGVIFSVKKWKSIAFFLVSFPIFKHFSSYSFCPFSVKANNVVAKDFITEVKQEVMEIVHVTIRFAYKYIDRLQNNEMTTTSHNKTRLVKVLFVRQAIFSCFKNIADASPSNTLYWADVGPIEFLVGNIGQLSRLSPDSQPTVSKMPSFYVGLRYRADIYMRNNLD